MLLQVLFHARVAADGDVVVRHRRRRRRSGGQARRPAPARLRGGTERIDTAERQEHRWEELKRAEKQRDSSVDGVPLGQPAVALAAKLISRTARAGLPADLLPDGPGAGGAAVRRRGAGQAGRRRPGGGAAHGGPPVRRRRPRGRALGTRRGPGPARARRRRLARPLAVGPRVARAPSRSRDAAGSGGSGLSQAASVAWGRASRRDLVRRRRAGGRGRRAGDRRVGRDASRRPASR